MPTFQPSTYSYGCDYGDLALTNSGRGVVAAGGKATKDVFYSVMTGGMYALDKATDSLRKRLGDAEGEATRWKQSYYKCKRRREKKGKPVYPHNSGKGLFKTDCREKHKEWKHYESKAARLAEQLQDKLKSKGLLDPEAEKQLMELQQRPVVGAEKEWKEALQTWESTKQGPKPNKSDILLASTDPELAAETLEGEGGGFPVWLVGIGALAAVGGIAYYVMAD